MENKVLTVEELEQQIWQRYGSFELSHEKNKGIVQSILEYVLKNRRLYAQHHVEAALEAAGNIANQWENSGELKPEILNAYPSENIK